MAGGGAWWGGRANQGLGTLPKAGQRAGSWSLLYSQARTRVPAGSPPAILNHSAMLPLKGPEEGGRGHPDTDPHPKWHQSHLAGLPARSRSRILGAQIEVGGKSGWGAPSFGGGGERQEGVRLTWLLGFHTCSEACWRDRQRQVRGPGSIPGPLQDPGQTLPQPQPC